MENLNVAGVFLAALGLIVIALVILWICMKNELCFFQKLEPRKEEEEEKFVTKLK